MNSKLLRAGLAIASISLAAPAAVSAQIYSWRDANGGLVVSNKPHEGATRTYVVAGGSQAFRSTRAVSGMKSQAYEQLISTHASTHGVSADLVRAVIQAESAFNPGARSVKGAMGLMQLMPATAAEYGVVNAYDPAQNIRAGVAYLKSLLTRYSNNEELALAAYNAGPGAVERYGAVPPYRETRNYVAQIRRNAGPLTPPVMKVYRTVEVVNGREVTRYSTTRTDGAVLIEPTGR
jgi:soluble lytic murein transglycosylase-like protein